MEIVTNGTLSPSQGLLDLFPNKRLNISVSNYGNLSCKIGDFTSNTAINATVSPVDHVWFDHGDLTYQGRTEQELIKQYSVCNKDRCVILNGKLYNCACSAFGADMEIFELKPGEYVDIRGAENGEQLRTQLNTLKRRSYFTSCNYCYWGTDRFVPIRPAEQIKK